MPLTLPAHASLFTGADVVPAQLFEQRVICTSHGLSWRKNIPLILDLYEKWASNKTEKKVVIIYDSMWGSTEKMAEYISNAFEEKGYKYRILDLKLNHISDVITEVIEAEYLCIGSPTLNKGILPTVASFLTYLQGLAPKGRKAFLFGSYGWAPTNMKHLERYMQESNIEGLPVLLRGYDGIGGPNRNDPLLRK